jgi:hypothetical protein
MLIETPSPRLLLDATAAALREEGPTGVTTTDTNTAKGHTRQLGGSRRLRTARSLEDRRIEGDVPRNGVLAARRVSVDPMHGRGATSVATLGVARSRESLRGLEAGITR